MSSTMPCSLLDDLQDFDVHEGGEDERPAPFELGRVVDLAHHLVRLVDRVDEGQPHVPGLELELGEDGMPKVSTVMPVPSETKKTVRVCRLDIGAFGPGARHAEAAGCLQ